MKLNELEGFPELGKTIVIDGIEYVKKREPLGLEIMDACGSEDYREGFKDGALYAEKCHGIGGE